MLTTRADIAPVEMLPGAERRTLCAGERTMLCEITLMKGTVVPWHTHPHEQTGYLSRGRLLFRMGDEERVLEPGDAWMAPGDVPHEVTALEDSVAIDIFSPPREEYR